MSQGVIWCCCFHSIYSGSAVGSRGSNIIAKGIMCCLVHQYCLPWHLMMQLLGVDAGEVTVP